MKKSPKGGFFCSRFYFTFLDVYYDKKDVRYKGKYDS